MNFSHTIAESCIHCSHCSKEISGKPWMSLQQSIQQSNQQSNQQNNQQNNQKHLCSYICYRREPDSTWSQVLNKEDFNTLFPVIRTTTTSEPFHYLRHNDLLQMSDTDISEYYERLDEERMMNPIATEIHETQEYEDVLTRAIEDESSDNDDY